MNLRDRSAGGVFALLGAFVVTAMVLGVLTAGLLMPAVGATASLARSGVDAYQSLPSEFDAGQPAQQSRILAADGTVIATPFDQNRIIVALKAIAPVMQQAQVAIEDDRFFEHGGIDVKGTIRGIIAPLFGEAQRGGSSITQQYVKMTLQDQALQVGDTAAAQEVTSRTIIRKLQELRYATQLEKTMTKEEILAGYLNLAYYGDGAYGVEAAARHYFNKHATKLTLTESAMLAGLVQNPSSTDPVNHPAQALERRDVVLDRMQELGLITKDEADKAKKVTLKQMLHVQPDRGSCANASNLDYAYFCDYVIAWLKTQPALGKTVAERIKKINSGGLTIQTTLDPKLMKVAKQSVDRIGPGNKAGIGSAAVTIEAGTGKVLAMAQNTTYSVTSKRGYTSLNYAVDKKYGGSIGFSMGSTMKAFSLITAFQQGFAVNSSIYAPGAVAGVGVRPPLTNKDLPGPCGLAQSVWSPSNDVTTRSQTMTLARATEDSVNTAFIELAGKVGLCNVWDTETALGMHTGEGEPVTKGPSAIVLGSDSFSPMTVATAYAAIAAEGKYCEPVPVLAITGPDRKPINLDLPDCTQVADKNAVRGATTLLRGVVTRGTGTNAQLAGGRPVAGKTGTAENRTEAWFVGYTPQLATAVWVGTPNSDKESLRGQYLPGLGTVNGWGGELAAPIFKKIMDYALKDEPVRSFAAPSSQVLNGVKVRIPSVIGMSVSEAKSALRDAGFSTGGTISRSSSAAVGTVIGTSPSGSAPKGSAVSVVVSSGAAAPSPTSSSSPSSSPSSAAPSPAATRTNNGRRPNRTTPPAG